MRPNLSGRGFTLVEILVVLAVIGILSMVVFANLGSARAKSRDAARVSDIENLSVALRLYGEANRHYPEADDGIKIDGSGDLLTSLAPYLDVPADPLGPGDTEHYYFYDSDYTCPKISGSVAVVYVTLEERPGNWSELCGGSDVEHRYGKVLN